MLTKDKVSTIQSDLQAALAEVAKKHGLSMSGTRIVFGSTDFKLTCQFADKSATGGEEIDPTLIANLRRNGPLYGFTMADVNREFQIPGKGTAKFLGLRGRFAIIQLNGKNWKYDVNMIAAMVKAAR